MNARQNASPASSPSSSCSTSTAVDAGAEVMSPIGNNVSVALIALARMLGRQAAAKFVRQGLPPHASNLEDLQNA
jgi:hypothetical protein